MLLLPDTVAVDAWFLKIFAVTPDVRSKDWFLMVTPWPTVALALLYLLIVAVGPRMMNTRNPFNLKWILIGYNFFIMLINLYIAVELTVTTHKRSYNWLCQPIRDVDHPDEIKMTRVLWWFFLSRILELQDTIFFLLRKKFQHVSFFHVFHHFSQICVWWVVLRYMPAGSSHMAAALISIFHVILYSYYTLAAIGTHMKKYLWWKKYLGIIELSQFAFMLTLAVRTVVFVPCDYPIFMQCILLGQTAFFIVILLAMQLHSAYNKKKHLPDINSSKVTQVQVTKVTELVLTNDGKVIEEPHTRGELARRRYV